MPRVPRANDSLGTKENAARYLHARSQKRCCILRGARADSITALIGCRTKEPRRSSLKQAGNAAERGDTRNECCDMKNQLIAGVGELDICSLCDCSPHAIGCPSHPMYDDDRCSYELADTPTEVGSARFWVEDTYAAAAFDHGISGHGALIEGIGEFMAAVKRGELRLARRRLLV